MVIIGLFATRGLLAFCGTYLFNWSTSKAVLALRTDLIRSIMRADANIYTQMSPGVVATRVINDPQNATGALSGAVTTLLRDGTTLLALLGYLFYVNWKLTLISLVTMPILGVVVRKVQKRVLAIGGKSYRVADQAGRDRRRHQPRLEGGAHLRRGRVRGEALRD